MDYESPYWEEWESKFRELAEAAQQVPVTGDIKGAKHYLCLYGDNGLTPEEELRELEEMGRHKSAIKRVEVDTSYWQDTVLFIP